MERPTGLAILELPAEAPTEPAGEKCDMAKHAYNSATRGKLAYFWLTFLFAIFLLAALAYAVVSFDDEESARGFIALIVAAGDLVTTGVFANLAKKASADADKMWRRVEKYCN